jgi:Chlorophyll A-B binding protein
MTRGAQLDEQGKMNVFAIEPEMYVSEDSQFGFNQYAEQLNGRLAMIGFIALIIQEVITGHGIVGFLANL